MFNKKYASLVLFLLLICIIASSPVSAADNATLDDVAADTIAVDSQHDVVADNNEEVIEIENQEIANESTLDSVNDDDELSVYDSYDVLSYSPRPDEYSVSFVGDSYNWNWYDGGEVLINIDTANQSYYYDFYLDVYTQDYRIVHTNIYSSSYDDYKYYQDHYYSFNISAESNIFGRGTYTMQLVNYQGYDDNPHVFDSVTLTVVEDLTYANIELTQSGTYYNAKNLTVQVTDLNNQSLSGVKINLEFSNGKTVAVTTDSAGKATYKVPFNAGNYKVKASPYSRAVIASKKSLTFEIAQDQGLIKITQSGKYATNKKLTFKVTDKRTGSVVENQKVTLKFSNGKSAFVKTNSKGIATYNMKFKPGTYKVTASATITNIKFDNVKLTGIKIAKTPVTINPKKLVTRYASGKYFKVKVTDKAKKNVGGVRLKVVIYTGGSKKIKYIKTKSTGWAKFAASRLRIGTHKVVVSVASTSLYVGSAKTTSIVVKKKS